VGECKFWASTLEPTWGELERRPVSGIERTVCALKPRVPVTKSKKTDRIHQIDGFHIFTWLMVLNAGLQSLTIDLE
jgi:hypothetical protein